MTLGSSILISTIIVSFLVLYIVTKDRWSWRRIVRWIVLPPLGLGIVAAGVYLVYSRIEGRPKPQAELGGFTLGSSTAELRFAKGEPDTITGDNIWRYDCNKYLVLVDENRVCLIGVNDHGGASLFGLSRGSSYESVIHTLGRPTKVLSSDNDLGRLCLYEHLNAFFFFRQSKVTQYGIFNAGGCPIEPKGWKRLDGQIH